MKTTTMMAGVLMAFSVFACGESAPGDLDVDLDMAASAHELTLPGQNPAGGVRDPGVRPVPVVPVVPVGGVRDPGVRPVPRP